MKCPHNTTGLVEQMGPSMDWHSIFPHSSFVCSTKTRGHSPTTIIPCPSFKYSLEIFILHLFPRDHHCIFILHLFPRDHHYIFKLHLFPRDHHYIFILYLFPRNHHYIFIHHLFPRDHQYLSHSPFIP